MQGSLQLVSTSPNRSFRCLCVSAAGQVVFRRQLKRRYGLERCSYRSCQAIPSSGTRRACTP